jgi:AcrR family transcriptional regulator
MARRKDHSPEELRELIRAAAQKIINAKGLKGLTARSLARQVGYTPGTIYNIYRDMDALIADMNLLTLDRLEKACLSRIAGMPPSFAKVRALAYAYVDFAHDNVRAWESIFIRPRKASGQARLSKTYRQKLLDLFLMIETVLKECLNVPSSKAHSDARLLWACLHGITLLTLDGRLQLIGIQEHHAMIDNLLKNYFKTDS